jgi:pimeloyl-ACP methyl ester carboxylesterase
MKVVFVHGACVKDGSWWWHRTGELLAEQGVASDAPALPSCGETGESTSAAGPGLAEDVAAVRRVLTASEEPIVLVAHSYGGIVTAEAAAGLDTVRHLLLISSYLPEVGQSLSSFGAEEPAPFLDIDPEGGTFTVRPDALADTFLQDCKAWRSSNSRCNRRPGGTSPRPTSYAPKTRAPPPTGNANWPAGRAAPLNSEPAIIRSSLSRVPYATSYSGFDGDVGPAA